MEPDAAALEVWTTRVNEIYIAAYATGFFVARGEPRGPRLVDDNVLEIYLELALGCGDDGRPLIPLRKGEREPWVIVEEWVEVQPDAVLQGYNYDLVDGAGAQHHGIHFHGHDGPAYPHRHGIGVPGGHGEYVFRNVGDALWDLVKVAFANRLGRGQTHLRLARTEPRQAPLAIREAACGAREGQGADGPPDSASGHVSARSGGGRRLVGLGRGTLAQRSVSP